MAEFVNIDQENESLNILPYSTTPIVTILPETTVVDGSITSIELNGAPTDEIISIDILPGFTEEVIDPICIHDSCDPSVYYGDVNENDSFKRSNLFSELTDEYQRAIARQNLGVADEFTLVWGNISGNLANQIDLYTFVVNSIASKYNDLIEETNLKLAQWGYEIRVEIEQKANILSPNFQGSPTTSLPEINDYSNRIPSTEWVTAKINESFSNTLTSFTLDKSFMYYGDSPQTVICSWSYSDVITSQKINGITLDINSTSYTFNNVNSDLVISLEYTMDGKTYTKSISFSKVPPLYYGTSDILNELTKTKDYSIVLKCNVNDYAYIYIPNKSSARISVDGLVGGFIVLGTFQLHGLTYYAFKSTNSGLGKLFINIL